MYGAPISGCRSRGYLPHVDSRGLLQHVVFGLADAIPADAKPLQLGPENQSLHYDATLDRGHGDCLLADAHCARIVQDELLRLDGDRYRLMAWCVMPNHVHVVLEQSADLASTVRRWKSWTAREINAALGRGGQVWRREYFDRYARDDRHLATMIAYVEANPVAAGLVSSAEEWLWSSVRHRLDAG